MRDWLTLLACLTLGTILVALGADVPSARALDAPAQLFSAQRAMRDVRAIARVAHPIGSPENEAARQHIVDRLNGMGLQVTVRSDVGVTTDARAPRFAVAGKVRNVIAELPGRDPALPAVLIMAHYDSVPHSPGAGDDAAGVAAALEIAGNLKASGPHERSVFFLLTDGEEPGLLGSSAFFTSDPLRERVGIVLNMEARGDSGRAALFETSPDSGGLVALYAAHVAQPSTDSLMAALYHLLPNNTDLTNALSRGFTGLNFAFAGDQVSYHTLLMTPERLNPGSVQHLGDQVLAIARALADARELPAKSPDQVYFDWLGVALIRYPAWSGWVLVGGGAMLLGFVLKRVRRRSLASWPEIARGVGSFFLLLAANALALQVAARIVSMVTRGATSEYALLGHYGAMFTGCVVLSIGVSLLTIACVASGRRRALCIVAAVAGLMCNLLGGFDTLGTVLAVIVIVLAFVCLARPNTLWGTWMGATLSVLTLACVLQAMLPAGAFMLTWPALLSLLAAAMLLAFALERWAALAVSGLAGVLAFALTGAQGAGFFSATGVVLPVVLSPFAPLALFPLLSVIWPCATARRAVLQTGVLAVVGLGVVGATAALSLQPTRAAPHLTEAFFVADLHARRFYRASQLPNLDSWARSALSMDGAQPRHIQWAPLFRDPIWLASAPPLSIEGPEFHGAAAALGSSYRVTLRARSAHNGRVMRVLIKPSVALTDTLVDEKRAALAPARGQWSEIDYYAPGQDELALSFTARERGSMDVWVLELRDGWPHAATAMPARPTDVIPWRNSDTTLIADRFSVQW